MLSAAPRPVSPPIFLLLGDSPNAISYACRMPDAQPAQPPVSWREQRIPPRHAPVWVRIAGTWRRGLIAAWVTTPGSGTWDCILTADEPPGGLPWQGRYVYDPLTIRPRHGEVPPG